MTFINQSLCRYRSQSEDNQRTGTSLDVYLAGNVLRLDPEAFIRATVDFKAREAANACGCPGMPVKATGGLCWQLGKLFGGEKSYPHSVRVSPCWQLG